MFILKNSFVWLLKEPNNLQKIHTAVSPQILKIVGLLRWIIIASFMKKPADRHINYLPAGNHEILLSAIAILRLKPCKY